MKIALKVLIVIAALISMGLGALVFTRDSDDAEKMGMIESLASGVGGEDRLGDIPSAGTFKTASYLAILCIVVALVLVVVSFMKNPKAILYVSIALMVLLLISYFIHPDFGGGGMGGKLSNRGAAMLQLVPGLIAGGLGIVLSRKVNS